MMANKTWKKIELNLTNRERTPLPIISTSSIGIPTIAEGRVIPLIMIDCSTRPDISFMIRAHEHASPGDVETIWMKPSEKDAKINLFLYFKNPSHCIIRLEFDILVLGGLVDMIVNTQSLYIQCGKPGDKIIPTVMDQDRIIIEVPSKSFRDEWNNILFRIIEKDYRKRGSSRYEAKRKTREFLSQWRSIISIRARDS